MGAYFLKKQARSPILEGFGRNIYALLSFSGQQYILLVFTLGTFIVNAQSVVEGTKFMDNWSVGVNAGAVTPLTHASFFKGMRPGFGVGISKQLTPSFRFGISGNGIYQYNSE